MDAKKQDKYVCSVRFDSLTDENGGKYRAEIEVCRSRNCRRGVVRVGWESRDTGRDVGVRWTEEEGVI